MAGIQADRLYVGDMLVWDGAVGGASGVPSAVAFDCDNYSRRSLILSWGPIDVLPGDVLVMAVRHEGELTVPPDGWVFHATAASPFPQKQGLSIFTRRYTTAETVSGTVTQSESERIQVGIVNMRGVSEVVSRPDLTAVLSKDTDTVTVPGKGRPGVVMWALCSRMWGSGDSLPYASASVRPWSASPGMWAPEWAAPSVANTDNIRVGMFLDVSDPGPRMFTNTKSLPNDSVSIVAVELVGT